MLECAAPNQHLDRLVIRQGQQQQYQSMDDDIVMNADIFDVVLRFWRMPNLSWIFYGTRCLS